jgi:hypothetical protein
VCHHGDHAYIFGGGANVPIYGRTLQKTLEELDVRITQVMRLPRPDINFATPKGIDDFGRLAVAYGVSTSADNMEVTRLPEEMSRILKKSLLHSIEDIESIEIACTCTSNPACAKCHGTGLLQGRDLRANLEAIAIYKVHEEIQQQAHPTQTLARSSTEKSLDELITKYGYLLTLESSRQPLSGSIVFVKYSILKKIELHLLSLSKMRMSRWENDARRIFEAAAREPRRIVYFRRGSAKRYRKGIKAHADTSIGHLESRYRPLYFTCHEIEANFAVKSINIKNSKAAMIPMMVKLIVPKVSDLTSKRVMLDIRPVRPQEMDRLRAPR